jgi:3-oxoacyl-[acyl-carrier protein] reductase
MDLNLSNKIVMITGASSGIGAAAANLFAVEGADIIIAYGRNLVGAENTQQLVGQHGRKSWICQMDLEKADSIHQAIQDLLLQVDHIDILVLCAGHPDR